MRRQQASFWNSCMRRVRSFTAEVLLRGMDQGDLDYREGMHPALVEPMPTVQRHAV